MPKQIRYITEFSALYSMGSHVMPSTHRGQAVLFAKRCLDGEKVVVKVRTKRQSYKDADDLEEWRTIMQALMNMDNGKQVSHICGVLEVVEDRDSCYCVMEYVRGPDLFDFCAKYKYQDPLLQSFYCMARAIGFQTCKGLYQLHSAGFIHKDLKLENIALDEKQQGTDASLFGTCKIIDFDTVLKYEQGMKAFDIMGTDQYIAPEAYKGYYSPASDMFALGVALYRALSGDFPFPSRFFDDEPGENYVDHPKMAAIRERMRTFVINYNYPNFVKNPEAEDFVKRCLKFEKNKRMTAKRALQHRFFDFYKTEAGCEKEGFPEGGGEFGSYGCLGSCSPGSTTAEGVGVGNRSAHAKGGK